ncbi:hypothetical protein C2G38_2159281 [Gigaspora rosea]|uniref:Uncharacterized protein n=1 Tax=Gigaspora rosea TaxID=44941 RepID=A0A397VZM4_9GLOM|nr:hypothetical protein C2G38_2159281 [Gigaspora rosea]
MSELNKLRSQWNKCEKLYNEVIEFLELNKIRSQWNKCEKLYNEVIEFFKVPFKPKLQLTSIEVFKCDLIIDLNELFKNPDIRPEVQIIRIYGDVIKLSRDLELPHMVGCSVILIAARRIEIEPGCQILINYKESFRIVVYTLEMPSELTIIAKNQLENSEAGSFKLKIDTPNKQIGKLLSIQKGKNPEYKDISTFEDSKIFKIKEGSFLKMLRFSLQIACALFYDEPEITQSILTWIINITRLPPGVDELYNQALPILIQFNILDERRKSEIAFIPLLDKTLYENCIDEFVKSAQFYENEYMNILDKKDNTNQKKAEFGMLLKDCNDITKVHEHLEESEYNRYKSALKLMTKLGKELMDKKDIVNKTLVDFKEGNHVWEQEKIFEAQKKMAIAVIDLTLSIGKIIAYPGGIISFVENIKKNSNSIKDALVAVNSVKGIVEKIDDVTEIKLIKNVNDNIEKIKQINKDLTSNLSNVEDLNDDVEKKKGKIESLDINTLAKILETEDRKGIYLRMVEWKSIKKDMRKLLNYPIELKIKGADEYLNSLDGLFNYIDAYIEAKIEEMESFKEHSRIKLQIEMFKKKETRLKKMIAVCEEKQNNYDEIEFLLFERLINTRFRKTIHEQIEDRNNIKREMETTLTRFKGEPQPSEHSIPLTEERLIKKI